MSLATSSTTYIVKLTKDGAWQWNNTPPVKFLSDYYTKFPPSSTPGFLVDLGPDYKTLKADSNTWPWKVISVQDLYTDDFYAAKVLLEQGWGAVSYAWGEYLPTFDKGGTYRPVFESREKENLPLPYIPPNVSPDVAKAWNWGVPTVKQVTVGQVKKVFLTLGKRFVWWDVVCLPQRDFSQGFDKDLTRVPPYLGAPWLPDFLDTICNHELDKQKFVYEKATAGAAWLTQIEWGSATLSKLEGLLQNTPKLLDLDTVRTIINTQGPEIKVITKDTPVWKILSNVLGSPSLGVATEWRTAIEAFCDKINGIRDSEAWFRSLWSFQEGRLMKQQAFLDKQGQILPLGTSYNASGATVVYPRTFLQVGNDYKETSSPNATTVITFVTLLASQISLAYNSAFGSGTAGMPIPPLVELWNTPISATDKRPVLEPCLQTLTSSGLLYYPEDSPLEIIAAARRSRFPSLFVKDAYFASTGVLGLVKVDETTDYRMKDPTNYSGPKNNDQAYAQWITDTLPKAFFEAVVKKYQWLALLLARNPKDKVANWGAVSMGHFEPITPYCENILVENDFNVERSDWQYILPQLTYLPDSDELEITSAKGFTQDVALTSNKILTSMPAKGVKCYEIVEDWGAKQCFQYVLDDTAVYVDDTFTPAGKVDIMGKRPTKPSNPVRIKELLPAAFGGKPKVVLIPFEELGFGLNDKLVGKMVRDPSLFSKRCLLIVDFSVDPKDNARATGTFGGIVDVRNLKVNYGMINNIRLKWQSPVVPPK
ncbi:uncharacterized protein KY384_006649 [Bacidia gigantensis]|uniref:uncharacterized protein n=1 Tax=Bacidia gigantensis TaxID=2732470 RepID=UPI001D04D8BA|nr:uncharacterized protein KY384_006649 [Bacidia gigantensis]KAG8528960.1 hypothetical protein KY384_006649 [Bacidia gigantensis]